MVSRSLRSAMAMIAIGVASLLTRDVLFAKLPAKPARGQVRTRVKPSYPR